MKNEMIRVSTFSKLNVEKFKVLRIERGVVVYMDESGSTYKEDKASRGYMWCATRLEAQGFINDTYFNAEKKARNDQKTLTSLLIEVLNCD